MTLQLKQDLAFESGTQRDFGRNISPSLFAASVSLVSLVNAIILILNLISPQYIFKAIQRRFAIHEDLLDLS